MPLRETMNKNPLVTGIVLLALIAAAGWFAFSSLMDKGGQLEPPKYYYYTVDDGKTTFSVSADEIPPIMHDGKEAVRVRVYSCDGGKSTFVGYLDKYTDEFKKKADAERAQPRNAAAKTAGPGAQGIMGPGEVFSRVVKKQGETKWVPMTSPAGGRVAQVMCPSGKIEDLTEKLP